MKFKIGDIVKYKYSDGFQYYLIIDIEEMYQYYKCYNLRTKSIHGLFDSFYLKLV